MSDPDSKNTPARSRDASPSESDGVDAAQIQFGDQAAHLAFQRQLSDLLDQADVTEEQRQQFLIAATCPCCGAGGLSLSLKLKSDSPAKF